MKLRSKGTKIGDKEAGTKRSLPAIVWALGQCEFEASSRLQEDEGPDPSAKSAGSSGGETEAVSTPSSELPEDRSDLYLFFSGSLGHGI